MRVEEDFSTCAHRIFEIICRARDELINLYGWPAADFDEFHRWGELLEEFHEVMQLATSRHFGVEAKPSTEAWAFDIARRRLPS
jgi:hypothetical protein